MSETSLTAVDDRTPDASGHAPWSSGHHGAVRAQEQPSPDRRVTVVIVDDSEPLRETLVVALGRQPGIAVVATAGDGDTATAVVAEVAPPDAVLLDLRLGDTCGLDLVPALRAGDHPPGIVVFSASSEQLTAKAAAQAGVDAHVTKGAPIKESAAALLVAAGGPRGEEAGQRVQMGP